MSMIKEIIKYYNSFYTWSDVDVKIIVSTGRTGTKFLANYFSENHSGIYSVHEPYPDLFELSMAKFRGNRSIYSFQKQFQICRYKQYKKAKITNKKIYLESNSNLAFLLPEAIELFKNPKIVFVTRDIKSYIISAYNKSPDNSNQNFFYGENDHRKRITPHDVNDLESSRKWEGWDRLEKLAWYWSYCNDYILSNLKSYPCYQVKFEDLFGDNKLAEMEKLSKYIGLSDNAESHIKKESLSEKRNRNSAKLLEDIDHISHKLKKSIETLTKDTRERLGYN